MTLTATRLKVPDFLRELFDCNLPELRNRAKTLEELLQQFFAGKEELRHSCIKAAHDLTGSLGVFGLTSESNLASEIEAALCTRSLDCTIRAEEIASKVIGLRESLDV